MELISINGVTIRVKQRLVPPLMGLSRFGLLHSFIALLTVVPMAMMSASALGLYPHSVGLKVRISIPTAGSVDDEGPIVLAVHRTNTQVKVGELEVQLNSISVPLGDLRGVLRARLSRSGNPVVYIEGDGGLDVGDVMRIVDITRDAW